MKAGLSNNFVDHEAEASKQQVARKRTGKFPPKKPVLSRPDSYVEEISDREQEEEVEKRRKRKGKAKATEVDEVEEVEPPVEKKRAKNRQASPDDDDQDSVEIIENPKAKRGARAASQARHDGPAGVSRGRSRPPNNLAASRQRSAKPGAEDEAGENGEIEEGQPAPRKKRKINLFQDEKGSASVLASVRVSLSSFFWQF